MLKPLLICGACVQSLCKQAVLSSCGSLVNCRNPLAESKANTVQMIHEPGGSLAITTEPSIPEHLVMTPNIGSQSLCLLGVPCVGLKDRCCHDLVVALHGLVYEGDPMLLIQVESLGHACAADASQSAV